jgi:hypothetical protein
LIPAVLLAALGCGGKDRPVPVEGVVTLDGKPIAGAAVVFTPEGRGRTASAETREDGSFRLTTFKDGDGAIPGNYKVLVTWEEPPDPQFRTGEGGLTREQMRAKINAEQEQRKRFAKRSKIQIPAVYGEPGRTPLSHKVPASGKVELKLDSKAK